MPNSSAVVMSSACHAPPPGRATVLQVIVYPPKALPWPFLMLEEPSAPPKRQK